ncbi:MAG: hypothetical protein H6811_00755 [Phycisphaeraceae bacterium]|nr:hypothetical protein [Phycisphaeraceae bacterium]
MSEDVFPATMSTWIGHRLLEGAGGRAEVNRHVMAVYGRPLRTYFLGCSERWLGEPDEVVHGFFADRLARPGFFDDWRESGLSLRRWLVNGLCFYMKELRRRRQRDARAGAMLDDPVTFSGDPERTVDREFVVEVVQRALDQGRVFCADAGLSEHWAIFEAHYARQLEYADIAPQFGVSTARAAVMARTASKHFKSALRELIGRDTPTGDVDIEIRDLVRSIE